MPAPRTTHTLRVRSYEIRPDGQVGSATLLNWFQEAAFANSTELGYPPQRYQEMGLSWVLRENDLLLLRRPRFDEQLHITTWLADVQRVQAFRQYEARLADGTILARCSTQWVLLDLESQRPTRIPAAMRALFDPAQDFILPAIEWPEASGEPHRSGYRVPFWEEDELGHVNNAVYLNWIEESARRAALAAGTAPPLFHRHRLQYRLPAFKDDRLLFQSVATPHEGGRAWSHSLARGEERLLRAWSLSD